MDRRRRRRGDLPLMKYIIYSIVGGMFLWLFLSIVKEKDPGTLLKSGLASLQGDTINRYMGAQEYQILIAQKDSIIFSLTDKIDELEASSFGIATVNVDSPTLNMRADPALAGNIVYKIPNGAAVEVQYYDTRKLVLNGRQGQWCKIKYADLEGWVWGNFLETKN